MKYRVMNPTRIVQNIFRRLSTSDTRFAPLTSTHLQVAVPKTIEGENITQNIRSHPPLVTTISVRTMSSEPNGGASCSKSNSHKNRLAQEKSPYLLQHATNPVDWYPWGEEAFEKARKEKKLIFLSVGYSTCHWCHVMEHESFENEEVAEIMNKYYVNIKVDREERPDIDKMYMSFIQATSGSGGWPMSVFLTPTLEPITGGTYFPPEDRWGTPGFKTVLQVIADRWNSDPAKVEVSGKNILSVLRKVAEKELDGFATIPPGGESVQKCVQQFHKSYEHEFGGFSRAPKFPQPSNFNFLFHVYSRNMESPIGKQCLNMCLHTLKCMALGGIHDHVSSGFARYSTDSKWHVPHFEKMLYDQGQLAVSYSDAYIATKDKFYAEIVRDILLYVSRDLSHPEGGFYSAEDADSFPDEIATHKAEGAFCVWEFEEINQYLTEKLENVDHSEIFRYHFNVKENGNVNPSNDPHGELLNKNVLIVYGGVERTAQFFNLPVEKVKEVIEKSLKILYEVRQSRPRPELDSKILTAWNGLMISGFAKSGYALKDDSYVQRALQAADFIKKNLYNEKNATLLRCCYRGSTGQIEQIGVPIAGFLDDYAFLIRGLLDLYEASLDANWLDWAEKLQDTQDRLFWDETHGGYFTSAAGDPSVLIRIKEEQDGAEPSGNSVSAQNLLRLGAYLDRGDFKAKAEKVLVAFAERLQNLPIALPEMMSALMLYQDSPTQIFIVGARTDPSTEALMDIVRTRILPGRLLVLVDGPNGSSGFLYQRLEILKKLKPQGDKATAYVCHHHSCSLPVTDPQDLFNLLEEDLRMQQRQ